MGQKFQHYLPVASVLYLPHTLYVYTNVKIILYHKALLNNFNELYNWDSLLHRNFTDKTINAIISAVNFFMNDEKKHKLIFLVYLKCRETRSKNGELCYMHFNMELPSLGWKHLVGATPLGEHRQWNISQSPFARKDVKEYILLHPNIWNFLAFWFKNYYYDVLHPQKWEI